MLGGNGDGLLRAELKTVFGVSDPLADELSRFAFAERRHRTHNGHRAIARLRLRVTLIRQDLDDAVAVFLVEVGDSLDCAGELFLHLRFPTFAFAYHHSTEWRMR